MFFFDIICFFHRGGGLDVFLLSCTVFDCFRFLFFAYSFLFLPVRHAQFRQAFRGLCYRLGGGNYSAGGYRQQFKQLGKMPPSSALSFDSSRAPRSTLCQCPRRLGTFPHYLCTAAFRRSILLLLGPSFFLLSGKQKKSIWFKRWMLHLRLFANPKFRWGRLPRAVFAPTHRATDDHGRGLQVEAKRRFWLAEFDANTAPSNLGKTGACRQSPKSCLPTARGRWDTCRSSVFCRLDHGQL